MGGSRFCASTSSIGSCNSSSAEYMRVISCSWGGSNRDLQRVYMFATPLSLGWRSESLDRMSSVVGIQEDCLLLRLFRAVVGVVGSRFVLTPGSVRQSRFASWFWKGKYRMTGITEVPF